MNFLIINAIITWAVIIFLVIKPLLARLEVEVRRTTWERKPYGITIYLWNAPKGYQRQNGRGVFGFNWRNPENIPDDINNKPSKKQGK